MSEIIGLSDEKAENSCSEPDPTTKGFIMHKTMYRIKDPQKSLAFYTNVLGMRLLLKLDFPEWKCSFYFMGYENAEEIPSDPKERRKWAFSRKGTIELTHNWGSENDDSVKYHNGNSEPRGFGNIGIMVPDVKAACDRFESLGVKFVKKMDEGKMNNFAFIQDPDGYWIEIANIETAAESIP